MDILNFFNKGVFYRLVLNLNYWILRLVLCRTINCLPWLLRWVVITRLKNMLDWPATALTCIVFGDGRSIREHLFECLLDIMFNFFLWLLRRHRAINLLWWAERLPRHSRFLNIRSRGSRELVGDHEAVDYCAFHGFQLFLFFVLKLGSGMFQIYISNFFFYIHFLFKSRFILKWIFKRWALLKNYVTVVDVSAARWYNSSANLAFV